MAEDIGINLFANTGGLTAGFSRGLQQTRQFKQNMASEMRGLNNILGVSPGQAGALAGGFTLFSSLKNEAALEKQLTRITQTAETSRSAVGKLRRELFDMAQETGINVQEQAVGLENIAAFGVSSIEQALNIQRVVNRMQAVSTASSFQLSRAIIAAATPFSVDLNDINSVTQVGDQMLVAGRSGAAELEALSQILPKVASNAVAANFSFPQLLGLLEGLSKFQQQPDLLANMANQGLFLFTDTRYLEQFSSATGIQGFENGTRRDPLEVLFEFRDKLRGLSGEEQQFVGFELATKAFDRDTKKALRFLNMVSTLENVEFIGDKVANASNTVNKSIEDALDNAGSQMKRLTETLQEGLQSIVRPLNRGFIELNKFVLDDLGLSGGALLGGAALAGVGIYGAKRFGGGLAGTAAGVAKGKAVEELTGVQPVFVVNMGAGGMLSGGAGAAGAAAGAGSAGRRFGAGRMLGGAGALLGALGLYNVLSDTDGGSAERAAGLNTLGLSIGAGIGGAQLGAAIGTVIAPGIGTAIGGVLGALVGGTLGNTVADGINRARGLTPGVQVALKSEAERRGQRAANAEAANNALVANEAAARRKALVDAEYAKLSPAEKRRFARNGIGPGAGSSRQPRAQVNVTITEDGPVVKKVVANQMDIGTSTGRLLGGN